MFPEGGGGGGGGGGEGDLDAMVFPMLLPGEPAKPFTGHRHEVEYQLQSMSISTITLGDLVIIERSGRRNQKSTKVNPSTYGTLQDPLKRAPRLTETLN